MVFDLFYSRIRHLLLWCPWLEWLLYQNRFQWLPEIHNLPISLTEDCFRKGAFSLSQPVPKAKTVSLFHFNSWEKYVIHSRNFKLYFCIRLPAVCGSVDWFQKRIWYQAVDFNVTNLKKCRIYLKTIAKRTNISRTCLHITCGLKQEEEILKHTVSKWTIFYGFNFRSFLNSFYLCIGNLKWRTTGWRSWYISVFVVNPIGPYQTASEKWPGPDASTGSS